MKLRSKEYPSKQTVNLAAYDRPGKPLGLTVSVLARRLLFFILFARFGLAAPLKDFSAAQEALKQKQEELAKCREYNEDYYQVEEQYRQYFHTYLTQEEAGMSGRTEVIRLLEERVGSRGVIETVAIQGNTCQLVVAQMPLSQISQLAEELESSPLIQHVSVSTAAVRQLEGQAGKTQAATADMSITLTGGGESAE